MEILGIPFKGRVDNVLFPPFSEIDDFEKVSLKVKI